MGKGSKTPAAPDPGKTAAAQSQTNKETAIAQALLNNVNQVGPSGSVTYKQIGSQNGVPQFQQTTSLSPQQQQIFNKEQQLTSSTYDLGNNQISRIAEALGQKLDFSGAPEAVTNVKAGDLTSYENLTGARDKQEAALYDRALRTLAPEQERASRAFETKLANQGIEMGSAAYKTAMDDFARRQADERDLARNSSIIGGRDELSSLFGMDLSRQGQQFQQGLSNANLQNTGRQNYIQEELLKRNQPINELAALLGTSGGVTMPQFSATPQTGIANTDYAGLVNNNYNAQVSAANQRGANQAATMGSLFNLGGTLGAAAILSDRRKKSGIRPVGLMNGVPLYDFHYTDLPGKTYRGVMAQEVLKLRPDAVVIDPETGYMAVNYGKLGLEMMEVMNG